jgi:hypothetical protein
MMLKCRTERATLLFAFCCQDSVANAVIALPSVSTNPLGAFFSPFETYGRIVFSLRMADDMNLWGHRGVGVEIC